MNAGRTCMTAACLSLAFTGDEKKKKREGATLCAACDFCNGEKESTVLSGAQ